MLGTNLHMPVLAQARKGRRVGKRKILREKSRRQKSTRVEEQEDMCKYFITKELERRLKHCEHKSARDLTKKEIGGYFGGMEISPLTKWIEKSWIPSKFMVLGFKL